MFLAPLMVVGKRVFEVVQMLAVDDLDLNLAGEPNKLAGPGIGHDSDVDWFAVRRRVNITKT